MAASTEGPANLYACAEEHGLARWLLQRSKSGRKWARLRGSPAAWAVLGLEVAMAQTARLGLEALVAAAVAAAAAIAGWGSDGPAGAEEQALTTLATAMLLAPPLAAALGAPPVGEHFALRWPSAWVWALAFEELLAAAAGARLEGWRGAGAARCLQLAAAAPLAEELFFRAGLLQLCASRMGRALPACAASALLFAAGHRAAGGAALLMRLTAGLALALRFAGSGRNLLEVMLLHGLHNAAAVGGGGAGRSPTEGAGGGSLEVVPLAFFSAMAVSDALRLGLLPGLGRRPEERARAD